MLDINPLISAFREVMTNSFPTVQRFATDTEGEYLVDDWKQANWEVIVESNLKRERPDIFLLPYGEGADYYGDSSRILSPSATVTHAVHYHSEGEVTDLLTGDRLILPAAGLPLDRFVAMRDGWYWETPPFDCVLLFLEGQAIVVALHELDCCLVPIHEH